MSIRKPPTFAALSPKRDSVSSDKATAGRQGKQTLKFSTEIQAAKEKVWKTIWEDKTFRDWASIIDEGTYMVGDMKEGSEVQFISSINGYGVTSFVEKCVPNEFALLKHEADTQESGQQEREKEWTGGHESYALVEQDGVTTLTVELDTPPVQVETFQERLPKALQRIKELAEGLI